MEPLPERSWIRHEVVLWQRDSVSCSCLNVAADKIEITLMVDGVVIDRQTFTTADAASDFAIGKMHAYNASY